MNVMAIDETSIVSLGLSESDRDGFISLLYEKLPEISLPALASHYP
jgi:hypothetical protein